MVTRTIKTKEVAVLCLNTITAEPFNEKFTIPANLETDEKIMKHLRATRDTETVKCVSIVNIIEQEHLYGMPEDEFIAHAEIIDPTEADTTKSYQ